MAFGIDKNKKGVKKQDIDASSIKQFNRFLSIEAAKVVAKYTKRTQSLLEDAKNNIRSLNIRLIKKQHALRF